MAQTQIYYNGLSHIEGGPNIFMGPINLLKTAPTWDFVNGAGNHVLADLNIDADGYPRAIPVNDPVRSRALWWPTEANGVYRYSGNFKFIVGAGIGRIRVRYAAGGADLVPEQDVDASGGPLVFDFAYTPNSDGILVEIVATNAANNVRDLAIVHDDAYADFLAGEMFDPEYIDFIARSGGFRAMKATAVNIKSPTIAPFYPPLTNYTWAWGFSNNLGRIGVNDPANPHETSMGWPLEAMVRLVNDAQERRKELRLRGNMLFWFTVPTYADDAFMTQTAEYLRDNLDPDIAVRVEFGNENFNSFESGNYLRAQATLLGGAWDSNDLDGRGTIEMGRIFKGVLGARCKTVYGGWWFFPNGDLNGLIAEEWGIQEPNLYTPPWKEIDEFATSFYPLGSIRAHDKWHPKYFRDLGVPGVEQFWRAAMEHADPTITGNAYVANNSTTPIDIPSLGANDFVNLWPAFRVTNTLRDFLRDATTEADGQLMLGADVDNFVRIVTPGTNGAGTSDIEVQDDPTKPGTGWRVAVRCNSVISDTVQTLVTQRRLLARGFALGWSDRERGIREQLDFVSRFGIELVIYEGAPMLRTGFALSDLEFADDVAWMTERYNDPRVGDMVTAALNLMQDLGIRYWTWFGDMQWSFDSNQLTNGQLGAIPFLGADKNATVETRIYDAHQAWRGHD